MCGIKSVFMESLTSEYDWLKWNHLQRCRGNVSVSNRLLKHIEKTSQHTCFLICFRGLLHSGPISNLGQTKIKATRGLDNVTACVQLPVILRHASPRLSLPADTLQRRQLCGISLHVVESLCILTEKKKQKKKTVTVWYRTCGLSPCVFHVKSRTAPRLGAGTRVAAVSHTVRTLEGCWKLFKVSLLSSSEMSWEDLDSEVERGRVCAGTGGHRK